MRPRRSLWLGLLAAGVVVAAFFWLAPPQLGGNTIFSATVGTSMEPLFHKGDLALVRPASSYNVGDIVLYESPVLHRPVLHRILVIQGGHYYFKGDNNDFVDPGYVTRDELLGKLWIHLPKVGVGLSFIGKPAHAGALGGLAVLVLLLGGSRAEGRRRRRRRATPGWSPPVVKIRAFPKLRRPRRTFENIAAGIGLTLGLLALLVGFTAPVAHMEPLTGAYDQTGSFTYSSTLAHPDAAYPDGIVRTGQPVFLTDFETLDVAFAYRFASTLSHRVTGTIGLKAVLSSESPRWSHSYVLHAPTSFRGDVAHASGTLDLHTLRALTHQLAIDTGTTGTAYAVTLLPTIRVRGTVAGTRIAKTFAPTLPFDFSDAVLALNVSSPATLPGATYDPPSTATTNETALEPVLAGSIPARAPNSITILKPRIAVSVLRGLGLGLTGLTLLALCTKPLRRKRETWSHEKRIAFRFGCVIVDVVSLESAVASTGVPTALPDFASLASFARYLERPILHDVTDGTYATEDSGRLYVFRRGDRGTPASPPATALELAPRVKASATRPRPARRRRTIVGIVSILFAGAIAAGLVTSFTAANTVPLSRAGVSKWPVNVNQVASSYCSSIVLTKQVIATSSTVTGTSGNDLVLGQNASGSQSLNGGSGDDCIIAGGTAGTINNFDGGAGTDICIGAPRATNNFVNCEYNGTLPASQAVTFSDWEGVSGTTLASIPTGTPATAISGLDAMETPINRGDNLGSRLQALVTAPTTGSYTFWIASDDNGRLYVSTNSDAANRKLVASVDSYTSSEAWDTFPSQQSAAVSLVAGQNYYVEAWSKEGGGDDNLSVAWSGPGITRQVISGSYLSAPSTGCSAWCPTDSATPYHALLQSFIPYCADVNGASQTVGTGVIDYPCSSSSSNQLWTLASNGSLQVYGSPKCMAPKNASLTAGTAVVISTCDASTSQTWAFTASTGQLTVGGLCLEVTGANTGAGAPLGLNTCDGQPEQYWSFVAGPAYTPDPPSILVAKKATVSGTSCADCTVKVSKSTGAVGATGPASTLVGTVTATATGTFTFAPGGALAVGNVITATSTTPLAVASAAAPNVATTS
jgi:signal peptidase I